MKDETRPASPDPDWLRTMNEALGPLDDRLTASFDGPKLPVTFILGTGRCGSTLLHQALAAAADLGLVSNLLARYWRAPYLGALLEADVVGGRRAVEYESEYGNTAGAAGPHEWGWFWQHWLGLEPDSFAAEWERVRDGGLAGKLAAIEAAKAGPLLFSNVYARANLDLLDRLLPTVLAVHLRRQPFYVCHSMLRARLTRHGSLEAAFGPRPRDGGGLAAIADPVEQVVQQVATVDREMTAHADRLGGDRVVVLDYRDLVADPAAAVRTVAGLIERHGGAVRTETGRLPRAFENRDEPARLDPALAERLKAPVAAVFGIDALPPGI